MDGIYSIDGLAGGTVSDELQATLQAISETSDGHQIKFKPAVSRRLTRWIVCRSYTGPIHELCHLVHIASQIDRSAGFENFFWGPGPATAQSFRRKIGDGLGLNPAAAIEHLPSTVHVNYLDGEFAIAHTRIQRHIIADTGHFRQYGWTVTDQGGSLNRRAEFAIFNLVSLGAGENELAGNNIHLTAAEALGIDAVFDAAH